MESLLREGKGLESIPAGALLTPTAKDAIKEFEKLVVVAFKERVEGRGKAGTIIGNIYRYIYIYVCE